MTPLDLFDRGTYSLTVSTPDESLATVRRTPQSTFVVAQGEGEGRGAQVRVELRICEECQKSKRKSKLAVGVGLLQIAFQSSSTTTSSTSVVGAAGGADRNQTGGSRASELQTPSQRSVTTADQPESTLAPAPTHAPASTSTLTPASPSVEPGVVASPAGAPESGTSGRRSDPGHVREDPGSQTHTPDPRVELQTDAPEARPPRVVESDLIRALGAMVELEVGVYALVGVSCLAIVAVLLSCSSRSVCVQPQKSPVQGGPAPAGPPQHPKQEWVWLGSVAPTAAPAAPAEPRRSLDSVPALPERTATLGRNRSSSQQGPGLRRSATLLARPERSEALHSPTSKRNQVQFTTFTTLDVKHLTALKDGGERGRGQQSPAADRPWPRVKPGGDAR